MGGCFRLAPNEDTEYMNILLLAQKKLTSKGESNSLGSLLTVFSLGSTKTPLPLRATEAPNPLNHITNTLNEEDLPMMIDFSKIVELVPDGGRLILTFTARADRKQNGDEGTKEVSVVFAQQFKGKENDNDFSPIIITGGVAELSEVSRPSPTSPATRTGWRS